MIFGALVLVASLPVWFPWVLKPLVKRHGLEYARYDRPGYTQFAVEEVSGRWPRARFEAHRVACVLPTTWLWRKCIGGTNAVPYLTIPGGRIDHRPGDGRGKAGIVGQDFGPNRSRDPDSRTLFAGR
jgi:hypothetical protein